MLKSGTWSRVRSAVPLSLEKAPKWAVPLSLVLICVLAFALRCLHLLRDDHYFIVSADSYYFHRMAELLALDETYFYPTHGGVLPIAMFSGITYPLALLARAIAFITPASPVDALELVSKLLPPTLGVITVLVLYFAVSRLYGRFTGLLSAFVWAILLSGVVTQAAGYLDRDCLSILLVVLGVFLFYFLRDWRFKLGNREFGWLICAIGVLAVEALLYIEWGFVGPAILLSIIAAFFLLQVLNSLASRVMPAVLREEDPVKMAVILVRKTFQRLLPALRESAYRPIALILAASLVGAASRPGTFRSLYNLGLDTLRGAASGQETIAEMQGIGYTDILSFGPLLVPIVAGLYVMLMRRRQADLLMLAWFAALFLGGLFARRLFLYAAPAMAIISGIAFAALLDLRGVKLSLSAFSLAFLNARSLVPYLRVGFAILLIVLTVAISFGVAFSFASTPPAAPDTEWYEALIWLRQNTPQEAVIMTWWDYGYWIMDVSHRAPVVDNGAHAEATDRDIARAYLTTNDAEAVSIMTQHGATHLVFSQVEMRGLALIIARAGLNVSYTGGDSVPPELEGSLYNRSFSNDFHSDYGLERVYPPADVNEPEVVIVALQ